MRTYHSIVRVHPSAIAYAAAAAGIAALCTYAVGKLRTLVVGAKPVCTVYYWPIPGRGSVTRIELPLALPSESRVLGATVATSVY